jgi:hypothetical protein
MVLVIARATEGAGHRSERRAQICHLLSRQLTETPEKPIDLDEHRGMAAQKATDSRPLLGDVEAGEQALRCALTNMNPTCWWRPQRTGAKPQRRRVTSYGSTRPRWLW